MAFAFIRLFETDDEEAARLAQAPAGSTSRNLSQLPVSNPHPDKHHLVELPTHRTCSGLTGGLAHACDGSHRIVVLPLRFHDGSSPADGAPRRHDGYWDCRVLASDHRSYPVGGYDICVSESELRRGRVLEL